VTKASVYTDTIRQIYGMVCNNVRSRKIIMGGVTLTLFGIITILGAVFTSAIAARGHHAFGSWQIEDRPITAPKSTVESMPKTPPTLGEEKSIPLAKPPVPTITPNRRSQHTKESTPRL
jgi:hypothetical protein